MGTYIGFSNSVGATHGALLNYLLPSLKAKFLFLGQTKNISDGKLLNEVGEDWLTVTGSAGSETFQAPDTAPYIAADTDYIWFKTDASQRTTTTAELVTYDLQRTPVKFDDSSPYALRIIAIFKAGETMTEAERDNLFMYFQLPILWDNDLNQFGHLKESRTGQNLWTPEVPAPAIPTGLTLTLISGGVKIDWTDNTGGTSETEIWGKNDSDEYALLYTITAGAVTKSETINPVDLRYYKLRSKKDGLYSEYTAEVSIAMLGPELFPQPTFDGTAGITIVGAGAAITGGKFVLTNANPAVNYSYTGNVLTINDKYRVKATGSNRVSNNCNIKTGGGTTAIAVNSNSSFTAYAFCTGDRVIYLVPSLNPTTIDIDDVSVKKILFP